MRSSRLSTAVAAIFTFALACGGTVVVSGSPAAIATIAPATIQPVPSLTASAPTTVSPVPTVAPPALLATLPAATRIRLPAGATSAVIAGHIQRGDVQAYVVQAEQGQAMMVQVESPDRDLTLSVRTQGGTSLLRPSAQQISWRGTLPRTEDYFVGVYAGNAAQDYTLTVQVAARIKFKEGANSATVSGHTVAGSIIVYSVFAIKGQKMEVSLSGAGHNAALSVQGYVDAEPYLTADAAKTSFSITLPSTQDYLIEVVPKAGKAAPFVLDVRIQ